MPYIFEPPKPSLDDIVSGSGTANNRELVKMLKALLEKLDLDGGVSETDYKTKVEESKGG